jgi:hypothetical protein
MVAWWPFEVAYDRVWTSLETCIFDTLGCKQVDATSVKGPSTLINLRSIECVLLRCVCAIK